MAEIELVYRAVGTRIQMLRIALGITQEDLAKRVGYTRTSLVNIEQGRQRIPLHQIEEIAKAIGCTTKHLLKGIWL